MRQSVTGKYNDGMCKVRGGVITNSVARFSFFLVASYSSTLLALLLGDYQSTSQFADDESWHWQVLLLVRYIMCEDIEATGHFQLLTGHMATSLGILVLLPHKLDPTASHRRQSEKFSYSTASPWQIYQ